jgi:hypothetical protein
MKRRVPELALLLPLLVSVAQQPAPLRAPAIPLVAHDPYFSIWSMTDRLAEGPTRHWTGATQPMSAMVRIDGKSYRIMGAPLRDVPVLQQTGFELHPTRTVYTWDAEGIILTLTFTTPALPDDLDILSRPATYIDWNVRSSDGKPHRVALYFDCAGHASVNTPEQQVSPSRVKAGPLQVLRVGSREQAVLAKFGDNLRIDWGYLYLAAPDSAGTVSAIAWDRTARAEFMRSGGLPPADDLDTPRAASDRTPVLAFAFDLSEIGAAPVARHIIIAYDDVWSIEYLNRKLRPYWRRSGMDACALLQAAERDFAGLTERCRNFDADLEAELRRAGGEEYARIATLSFRQTLAAHKLVADFDGTPLYFSKENFSNGCIDTVDVTYPSSPFFLAFNTRLLKGQLIPILEYASLPRWKFPFAPHDLGTYPLANGQVYGGREENEDNQMPVEESGNMLLMLAGVARLEGNADLAAKYWPVVTRWANYLREKGLDPENQLCTDDFAGHLAHNANLSLKAILAVDAYARLCEMTGKKDEYAAMHRSAVDMAARWQKMADDGDHYRLTFDKPGTWSQKYNLVWDRLLGLNLFPAEVARKEVAYYKSRLNAYGLPLDNRKDYTKLDWEIWTATLAESPEDFTAFVTPIYRWLNEAPDRVPLTDWYSTVTAKQQGFQARSVVGGTFIKLLSTRIGVGPR